MNIDVLSNDELIDLYKSHNWSLNQMDKDLNLGKEHSRRLFNNRGIDFNTLKRQHELEIIEEYNKSPNHCQYKECNKVLDWEHRNNKYCSTSCAAKSNEIKKKTSNCLFCGITIPYKNKFCSNDCQRKYESEQTYKDFLENNDKYCRPNYTPRSGIRNHILLEQNNICAICNGLQQHNGKPLVFVLDHIDGYASNNKRDNLRMICPNCDSQLDTFKSKNKHSTRRNYWKEKILNSLDNENEK